ncbi:MAG: exodeoxyribonuclease III [Verrucomicrobiota bacterium]|nr:MAG: exodeoxyribonuclease III [Verrucomicrobiota bacterium]
MKIATWNINGLRAILQKNFEVNVRELNPDILCLQEIKIQPSQIEELSSFLEEYPFRYYHSAERPGYAGTTVLSKTALKERKGESPDVLIQPQEGRVQVLDVEEFYLVNVYTPNVGSELARLPFRSETWDPEFCAWIDTLRQERPVLVCGDFNVAHEEIDLAHPERCRGSAGFTDEERSGFDRYISRGWVDVFRSFYPDATDCYTWWSYRSAARQRNVGWRIDYFLASDDLLSNIRSIAIYPDCLGSDHAPVMLDLTLTSSSNR